MDALRTKGVSKFERFKENGFLLLIVIAVAIVAAVAGAVVGVIVCVFAAFTPMTFWVAWSSYGFIFAAITTVLLFIGGLLLVLVLGMNAMMAGILPRSDDRF